MSCNKIAYGRSRVLIKSRLEAAHLSSVTWKTELMMSYPLVYYISFMPLRQSSVKSLYKINQKLLQIYNIMVSLEMTSFQPLESWRNKMNSFW